MKAEWVREVRDQRAYRHVPFFFKQWGGTRKHLTGRVLDGRKGNLAAYCVAAGAAGNPRARLRSNTPVYESMPAVRYRRLPC